MRHAEVARLKSKRSAPQPFDFSGHWKTNLAPTWILRLQVPMSQEVMLAP